MTYTTKKVLGSLFNITQNMKQEKIQPLSNNDSKQTETESMQDKREWKTEGLNTKKNKGRTKQDTPELRTRINQ